MRITALLVLGAMAAILVTVLLVQPRALRKEPGGTPTADISHPPTSVGSTAFVAAPHIAPDAKAAAAR